MGTWGKSPRFDKRGMLATHRDNTARANGGAVASVVFRLPTAKFYWTTDMMGKPVASPRTPRRAPPEVDIPKLKLPKFALEVLPRAQTARVAGRTPRRTNGTCPRTARLETADRKIREAIEVEEAKRQIKKFEKKQKSQPSDLEYLHFIHDVQTKKSEADVVDKQVEEWSARQNQNAGSDQPNVEKEYTFGDKCNGQADQEHEREDEESVQSEISSYLDLDLYDRCKKLLGMPMDYQIEDPLTTSRNRVKTAQGRRPAAMRRQDPVVYYDEDAFADRFKETRQLRQMIRAKR